MLSVKKSAVGSCFVDRGGRNGVDGDAPNDGRCSATVKYVADLVKVPGARSSRAVGRNICHIADIVVRVMDERGAGGTLVYYAVGRKQNGFVHSVVAGARHDRICRAGPI